MSKTIVREIKTVGDWRYYLARDASGWWVDCRAEGGESELGPYDRERDAVYAAQEMARDEAETRARGNRD